MLTERVRNRHFFALDLFGLAVAAYFSFVLRLETVDLNRFWWSWVAFAAVAVIITPIIFRWAGIYSRFWRYASIDELLRLTGAVTLSSLSAGFLTWLLLDIAANSIVLPRSIPFIFLPLAPIMATTLKGA